MLDTRFRGLQESDHPYVFHSWIRSARNAEASRMVSKRVYTYHQHALIEGLMRDKSTLFVVACDPKDPDFIHGYVCGTRLATGRSIVHYVYVRNRLRRFGLGTELLKVFHADKSQPFQLEASTLTRDGRSLLEVACPDGWEYNPYAMYYWLEPAWQAGGQR